jgi:long-chain fatty acid transport protein
MKLSCRKILTGLVMAAAVALPSLAQAENGMNQIGYGVKSKGMGGVGIALPQDTLAAATNPAGMVMVGDRADAGLEYVFQDGESVDTAIPVPHRSHLGLWYPEVGINWNIEKEMSFGLSIFVPSMFRTEYHGNLPSLGIGRVAFKFESLFITPSWSMQIDHIHSIGLAINICVARLKISGLEGLESLSLNPEHVTNEDWNNSEGISARFGWIAQLTPEWRIGASAQTKTWMSKFKRYKGFLPTNGTFDLPAQLGVGVAWQALPEFVISADILRTFYRGCKQFNNTGSESFFGATGGAAFGWDGLTAYKIGFAWDVWKYLTVRAGYNYGHDPIHTCETWLNQLTLATITHHITAGASWAWERNELSFAYVHGFRREADGRESFLPGRDLNLKNTQNTVGISYGRTF